MYEEKGIGGQGPAEEMETAAAAAAAAAFRVDLSQLAGEEGGGGGGASSEGHRVGTPIRIGNLGAFSVGVVFLLPLPPR